MSPLHDAVSALEGDLLATRELVHALAMMTEAMVAADDSDRGAIGQVVNCAEMRVDALMEHWKRLFDLSRQTMS
ncbi:hypothetical protein [Inquilinus sp. Marseille-Q2685]|uniref:hypothetical protein n=1 Tax=Inquilinus sp. Marseille-Q2685 TaxID=2866581 RepID=UPI001CE45B9E|nr:hypothetical protein [Inquilinus sp. Marseille-Q2685]